MTGGRIGKDGIHGATFSSEELHEDSPVTAVQIGDPITQKKMTDFLLIARDRGLYRAITDNGAGGLSSSVGEMARMSGGCEIDLEKRAAQVPRPQPLGDPALRVPGADDPGRPARRRSTSSSRWPRKMDVEATDPRAIYRHRDIPHPLRRRNRGLSRHGIPPRRASRR